MFEFSVLVVFLGVLRLFGLKVWGSARENLYKLNAYIHILTLPVEHLKQKPYNQHNPDYALVPLRKGTPEPKDEYQNHEILENEYSRLSKTEIRRIPKRDMFCV